MALQVFTAVTGAAWESELVGALDRADHGVTVVRPGAPVGPHTATMRPRPSGRSSGSAGAPRAGSAARGSATSRPGAPALATASRSAAAIASGSASAGSTRWTPS